MFMLFFVAIVLMGERGFSLTINVLVATDVIAAIALVLERFKHGTN